MMVARLTIVGLSAIGLLNGCAGQWSNHDVGETPGLRFEQRNSVSYLRGPYNFDFYSRHNKSYRTGAAIHFAHGKAHDVPQLSPFAEAGYYDQQFAAEAVQTLLDPPRVEPQMDYWGSAHESVRLEPLPGDRLDAHAPRTDL